MSVTFEYSFNAPHELSDLVDKVNRVLGTSLISGGENAFQCDLLGLPLVLDRHSLENDRDLNFENYRYQLWIKTWAGDALRIIQLEVLILAAFVLQQRLNICEGMLSYDRQRLLARYDLIDGHWCDLTTREAVDPTPHIVEILRRLDDWVVPS